ncbi:MAG: HAMP domain-containing histidine kinase [Sulfuricurvum sp.]|uniref:sensor histidine kinase n=1 Tax=Sulfuricurvum sp. TaxID=2025608 RepID=UPI0025ED900E|nr:HAMP domain-containing sensor histidine kinase [Sulfuricurvum sp.]MBV5320321.1 HAMP domain-containing histidine kinase [Sulfuricurvum sp.]
MNNNYSRLIIAFGFFLAVLAGYGYYSFVVEKERINDTINGSLSRSVHLAHRVVGDTFHDKTMGVPPSEAEYWELVQTLSELAHIEGVKYIYTLIKDENGTFRFTSSSATEEELRTRKNLSYFYDIYDADPAIDKAMKEQREIAAEVTDSWGNFRSLFVGYTTPNNVQYVIGVDIEIDSIEQMSRMEAFRSMGKAILLIIAALPIFFLYRSLLRSYQIQLQQKVQTATVDYEEARNEAIIAMQQAQQANRAKDAFLSNMSHELRTPLNAIIGFSQILMIKKDTPDSIRSFVEKINISGKNLLSLVNTILDFSKIEAGKMDVEKTTFSISGLIEEVNILIEPMAEIKNIRCLAEVEDEIEVYADRQLIKQVLINLMSNAIKFSPDNETVTFAFTHETDRDVFCVSDHGHGIPAEKIESVFEAFTQIREHQNDSIKGTGLGLSLVKKIIEIHNGEIWVKSVVGEGSKFFFSLPIYNEESLKT